MEQQILATQQDDEIEIDLAEIVRLLWRNLKWIIAFFMMGAIVAAAFTKFFIVPQYQSTSKIYILTQTTSLTSLADLQIGESLTADFSELAESRPVVEKVIEELSLDTTYEEFLKIFTTTNPSDTRILAMHIQHSDAQLAADISNAIAIALIDRVAYVMNTDRPSIVEEAVPALEPISPSLAMNTAIGALIGAFVIVAILLLRYFLDDTIKDSADVEKYLSLNMLANIPVEIDEETLKNKKNSFKNAFNSKKKSSSHQGSHKSYAQLKKFSAVSDNTYNVSQKKVAPTPNYKEQNQGEDVSGVITFDTSSATKSADIKKSTTKRTTSTTNKTKI